MSKTIRLALGVAAVTLASVMQHATAQELDCKPEALERHTVSEVMSKVREQGTEKMLPISAAQVLGLDPPFPVIDVKLRTAADMAYHSFAVGIQSPPGIVVIAHTPDGYYSWLMSESGEVRSSYVKPGSRLGAATLAREIDLFRGYFFCANGGPQNAIRVPAG